MAFECGESNELGGSLHGSSRASASLTFSSLWRTGTSSNSEASVSTRSKVGRSVGPDSTSCSSAWKSETVVYLFERVLAGMGEPRRMTLSASPND